MPYESPILANLNPQQRLAVAHSGGPLLIIAGPGSGKTRVITQRIAFLIQEEDVHPYRILAVTFTNKAAREMKERLRDLIDDMADDVTMGTFHSVCIRMLRVDGARIGLERNFVIYDDDDQMDLIKHALSDLEVDTRRFTPRAVLSAIGQAKSQLLGPEEYSTQSYFDEVVRRAYFEFQRRLVEAHALDFDDIIMRTVQLFRQEPEVIQKYQSRYLHALIDEFQDTNIAQYVWARLLAEQHRNICVVGDPDQSIYSWRSADIRNILNFEQDYPDATVVHLDQNYRSTKTILEAAQILISSNRQRKEKHLWTENVQGDTIMLREAYDEEEEAYFVVKEIERLVKGTHRWGDCAIMYRTNAQSRALEEALVRAGTPYKLVGATRFYERREIKDVLAYLRLSYNPFDGISFQRVINVPTRGIGQKTLEELGRWAGQLGVPMYTALQMAVSPEGEVATLDGPKFTTKTFTALQRFLDLLNDLIQAAETRPVGEFFDYMLSRVGYRRYLMNAWEDGEERWENVEELQAVANQFSEADVATGMASFLENVSLVSDVDNLEASPDVVTLITLHQAKGLEFPIVFIAGMEEGVLPHMRSFDNPAQMEEERRLAYVGFTRAKERLYLLRSYRRNMMGSRIASPPSRFLRDIPEHLIEVIRPINASSGSSGGSATSFPPAGSFRSSSSVTAAAAGRSLSWEAPEPEARVQPRDGQRPPMRIPIGRPAAEVAPVQTELYKAGDHVRHEKFGEGIVLSCVASNSDHVVTVAFKGDGGIKKLMLSFAPLEKLA